MPYCNQIFENKPHLKNFAIAASSAIDKSEAKVDHRTKLAVIKHVLQRNLVNREQHKNQALRSFFVQFLIAYENRYYRYSGSGKSTLAKTSRLTAHSQAPHGYPSISNRAG